jgi:hypothetical protein
LLGFFYCIAKIEPISLPNLRRNLAPLRITAGNRIESFIDSSLKRERKCQEDVVIIHGRGKST